ncbi:SPOR domain-containing protein [Affinibrenneria salicis]|uniref:Cell division protein DamX n=1 Tax=Affinibrenneria salicis TaxID=2590031 RepID=A0A5J5FSK7_9GAMM|nr:SPOR domain-containing protein [Affinibrenneria salicis]KAA8996368.1 SPOR domain-containing protein [Affinibrenneria salicis]
MDEFKPEDELKPDTSDRRPARQQKNKGFSAPKIALSRQHMMIGIGILVLLLLIIGIGSALQAPTNHEVSQQQAGAEKSIDLSAATGEQSTAGGQPADSGSQTPQVLNAPEIAPQPTQAAPREPVSGQQRVELPGNMTDALSHQQGSIDDYSQGAIDNSQAPVSSLPTAPARVGPAPTKTAPATTTRTPSRVPAERNAHNGKSAAAGQPKAPVAGHAGNDSRSASPAQAGSGSGGIQAAPASHFTVQLSSASRSDTLKAFAVQHNLTGYWVYETKRDGKPWYVLVNGVYSSSAEARRAIAPLPADVQAKKPWVKPIRQVKQDLNK